MRDKSRYHLSQRSLGNLEGVSESLAECVRLAITMTSVDFIVIEGLRSRERQKSLFESGASKTMKSNHLTGRAVDLMAYTHKKASWALIDYYPIAEAMRKASIEVGIGLRWGAAWSVPDLGNWQYSAHAAVTSYKDLCASKDRAPFIDAPHFELIYN